MNHLIDAALASAVRSIPDYAGIPIRAGTEPDTIDGEECFVVCASESLELIAANYWVGEASIIVSSPGISANENDYTSAHLDQHRTLSQSLFSAFSSPASVAAIWPTDPTVQLVGSHTRRFDFLPPENDRWLAELRLAFGVLITV
jgi:hypothetical protein